MLHAVYYGSFYSTARRLNTIEPYAARDRLQGIDANHGCESDPVLGLVLGGYRGFAADLAWQRYTSVRR
ncbi:hypothetical protein EAH75_18945 [Rhodanobacter glycinis]|uniref:Uncharacterized protein n=1 Tax=Rhodanobacter glycinis TaxID=582702 RepID=A0A502BXT1_9GAMM|nr:hypothetical protein EAH88_18340 [Rhodanobacter glycinis]TPG44945.1 hypothetical protein EAH75_18945 [Rhodanobacter glycinis]